MLIDILINTPNKNKGKLLASQEWARKERIQYWKKKKIYDETDSLFEIYHSMDSTMKTKKNHSFFRLSKIANLISIMEDLSIVFVNGSFHPFGTSSLFPISVFHTSSKIVKSTTCRFHPFEAVWSKILFIMFPSLFQFFAFFSSFCSVFLVFFV